MQPSITNIPGISVGHYTDKDGATGCTVILTADGATAGVDVRGGAPGTRDVALLNPVSTVTQVHGIVLSGGSAFGLAAADGVMTWLEEQNVGFETGVAKIPIVPTAILFDLAVGSPKVRPTAANGYTACQNAHTGPAEEGSVGAGTGATIGKLNGPGLSTKGGIGSHSVTLDNGLTIGALVAVNAIGDVIDPATQKIIAGARTGVDRQSTESQFADSMAILKKRAGRAMENTNVHNTTIGVIATNAQLTKVQATKVAQMAHDGLARTIRPIHTSMDGDTIFALATNQMPGDPSQIGAIGAEVMAEAVIRAVRTAESLHGVPSAQELNTL